MDEHGQELESILAEAAAESGISCERVSGHLQFVLRRSDHAGDHQWRTSTFRWTVENGEARNVGSDYDGPAVKEADLPQPDHSLECEGVRSPS